MLKIWQRGNIKAEFFWLFALTNTRELSFSEEKRNINGISLKNKRDGNEQLEAPAGTYPAVRNEMRTAIMLTSQ
jgi:hypothetical protein